VGGELGAEGAQVSEAIGTVDGGRRLREVLLLRDVPEQQLLSMERFADEMERGFAAHPSFRMTAATMHESAAAATLGLRRIDSYVARFLRYPLAAARRRADIYHIADHGYAHLAAFLPRDRTVVTCHDLMLLKGEEGAAGFKGRRTSVARFRWSTSYLRKVAHVVCASQSTKGDLVRLRSVPEERISIVPYGVNSRFQWLGDEVSCRLKAAMAGTRQFAVLHVSTGSPYKNVPVTLQVVAALRRSGMGVTLVRVGKPLSREERALAEELWLAASVIECGRVSDERLVELYNACDLLLFPSHYEGFGWPPLEAMACGTPVVTSNCPSLVEIVGGAGLVAPPDDVGALAAAARAVLESSELAARLRRQGLERAAEYTWERTVTGYAQVYEMVTEDARQRQQEDERERQAACVR